MKVFILLLSLQFIFSSGFAQTPQLPQKMINEFNHFSLPPIDTLIQHSTDAPEINYYKQQQEIQKSKLKSIKRDWLSYISAAANYQYGNGNTSSTNQTNQIYQYSNSEKNWYSVGAGLSLPLDNIFDRHNRIKRQELAIQSTKYQIQQTIEQRKNQVIELYTTAEQYLDVIKYKVIAITFAQAQFNDAKNDFINGKINSKELNDQKQLELKAQEDFIKTRTTLKRLLLQLETLSRTQIINK